MLRYFVGGICPSLLQAIFVFIMIELNSGNGSWLGLATFLIFMFAIPLTIIVNIAYLNKNKEKTGVSTYFVCFAIALVVPIATPFLLYAL